MKLENIRCVWCDRFLWPFQKLSPGGSMHYRCHLYVKQITVENQKQYMRSQAELRWKEEDQL